MRKHRHHPKLSWRLMYDVSTNTELRCYKCKATIELSRVGWFVMFALEPLCTICVFMFLLFILQRDMVKLSMEPGIYTLFWLGILLVTTLLTNIICMMIVRFFMLFREKD